MTTAEVVERHVVWRGGNLAAYDAREPEILLEGPAGTGKTFCILHKIHDLATDHPGFRGLILRKVAVTLGHSTLPTLEQQVFSEWDNNARRSALDHVHFYGGSEREAAAYVYDNGSRITIGGMDQASKVLGSFYDVIFFNQAEESTEEDLETLKTRLRAGNIPNNRLYADCNPSYDRHYLLKRCASGLMRRIRSSLRDNPRFYDEAGDLTEAGREYVTNQLEGLTGTRRQRLLLGEWIGMENAIYADAMDATKQFIDIPDKITWSGRAYGGMDFGRVHLSAVCAITVAADSRVWVREVWTGHNDKEAIKGAAREHRLRFKVLNGVTDPLQDWAAQDLGWKLAKSGAGSRKSRIQRVLSLLENDQLRFDRWGEGVQDLWDEMQMYRYEVRETDTVIEDVVVRKDDDRVAALEYAVEAMETVFDPLPAMTQRAYAPRPQSAPRPPARVGGA